ncbi:MAG: hypothetical protein M5U01_31625 [Ardenticatenaceae bacterium]|nr:hypothetical protein [Ardenticatenaceae bacterium]HBY92527.1 hypothetical protein [Chloroflexota bacterium]
MPVLTSLLDIALPLVVSLLLLLWLNRLVTVTVVRLFWHFVGDSRLAFLLYALLILPGTAVHELSHWLAARLLGVRAELPVLLPRTIKLQGPVTLGHVMIARTDVVRRSLIGVAPFLAGSALVVLIARQAFGLDEPTRVLVGTEGALKVAAALLRSVGDSVRARPDAWLYLYLLFAISNGMLPSPSDREAWPWVAFLAALVVAATYLFAGVPELPAILTLWLLRMVRWLTFAFLVTVVINTCFVLGTWPLERLVAAVRGGA